MNLFSFLTYCIIVTFTPGPSNIMILSTVQHYGTKKALQFTYGATIAFFLLLILSAFLNNLFISYIPSILPFLQIIGTIYMLYLAYQILHMDIKESVPSQAGTFFSGLYMQFLNPKVILFTFTVLPSYIYPYYNSFVSITMSILCITFIGLCAFLTWVLFGTIFKKTIQKHFRLSNTLMAAFLIYSAIMIWI